MFEVRNIAFSRGGIEVLSGTSFSAASGEVVAVVGANGAGKTTLLKILAGIWLPTGGTVVADGVDIVEEPIRHRRRLGWLGETAPAESDMTVKAYLKYRAKLKGEQRRKIRHRVREAMAVCALEQFVDARIARLSHGQRKRVAIAEAILLRPRLLLLDDLFAGIDEDTRSRVAETIVSMRQYATVIIAGHERDWFERIGARIVELKDGRVA